MSKLFSSKISKLAAILVVCGLLIITNPKRIFDPVRLVMVEIAYPFEKIFYFLGKQTGDTMRFLGSISDLKTENEKLLKENMALSAQVAELSDQKKENEELRSQLDLAPRGKFDLAAASVIGRDPNAGSWIMIDKGRFSGIASGMPVIVSDGILIGKIGDVYENSSKAVLISDASSSVNAMDLETGAAGVVKGVYGLGLMMDMVEQTDILNFGDTLVTSGLGGMFPKGLLIGKINQVSSTQDKLFQQAAIVPGVKFAKTDFVFVLKK